MFSILLSKTFLKIGCSSSSLFISYLLLLILLIVLSSSLDNELLKFSISISFGGIIT